MKEGDFYAYPYVRYISDKEWQCSLCNKIQPQKNHTLRHIRAVHKDEIDWNRSKEIVRIKDCGQQICSKLYGTWYKELWCEQCIVRIKSNRKEKQKKSQQKRTGPNRIKRFRVCPECGKNVESLSQHLAIHDRKETKCPQCDEIFRNQRCVDNHIKAVHDKIPCVECGKLIGPSKMKIHLQGHLPDSERKHKCEVCFKGFVESARLKDHMNIHTGEKPYKCKYCSSCFASQGNQRMHERSHEGYRRNQPKNLKVIGY